VAAYKTGYCCVYVACLLGCEHLVCYSGIICPTFTSVSVFTWTWRWNFLHLQNKLTNGLLHHCTPLHTPPPRPTRYKTLPSSLVLFPRGFTQPSVCVDTTKKICCFLYWWLRHTRLFDNSLRDYNGTLYIRPPILRNFSPERKHHVCPRFLFNNGPIFRNLFAIWYNVDYEGIELKHTLNFPGHF
jgi:hypothetical protein